RVMARLRGDGARVFVTALLVYVAFWNPWLQFSNSDNFVDGAVSLVDTGRWQLAHWPLYEGKDTATARDGRVVPGVPFGTSLAIVPLYAVWRAAGGAAVEGWTGLEAVNAVAILLLCAPAMALTAVQVAWLAGWLGATRRGRVLAALLFALGTQAFQFGTMLTKESLTALAGLATAWRGARRAEAALTVTLLAALVVIGASWQSQFADRASWSHGLGARYLFPALPLLAAFTGVVLERLGRRALLLLAVPSLVCGYLGAQAGFAPVPNALPYALKTFVSGTGMGVLFKEALPVWTGLDTLHTVVARPDVSARDLLARLPTLEGLTLTLHQVLFFILNALALLGVSRLIARVWRPRALEVPACAS